MDGNEYLYVGLTIVWFGIFAYMVYLHRMQAAITKKLESIEMRVKKDEQKE